MSLFYIFSCLVWGFCCSLIAEKKGYNKYWAWFWGIFGGLIAVVVYLCLGKTKEKQIEEVSEIMAEAQKKNEKTN